MSDLNHAEALRQLQATTKALGQFVTWMEYTNKTVGNGYGHFKDIRDKAREFLEGSPPKEPRVLVTISGGIAEAICDEGVNVVILDYDIDGDSEQAFKDDNGDDCEQRWVAEPGKHNDLINRQFNNL